MRALMALVVTAGSAVQPVTALAATGVLRHVRNVSWWYHTRTGRRSCPSSDAPLPSRTHLRCWYAACAPAAPCHRDPLTIQGAGTKGIRR
jgi:hypothetical protein